MAGNAHAALRLAHPTVVPGPASERDEDPEPEESVDVTGSHPTVRVARVRGD